MRLDPAPRPVLIVGGGFAGIAAAVALAREGYRVELLEARPFLGGRAYSFREPASGAILDNGQHILIGAYTNALHLLDAIGASGLLAFQDDLDVVLVERGGRMHTFRSGRLPAPLHLLGALFGYSALSFRERWAAAGAALAALRLGEAGLERLEGERFDRWLERMGQGNEGIDRFWEILSLATINGSCRVVSAMPALTVLERGFLRSRKGARIAFARGGLSELYVRPAIDFIERRGGTVRAGAFVESIAIENGQVRGVRSGGRLYEAGNVVLAVPAREAARILADGPLAGDAALWERRLGASPIVNLHLSYGSETIPCTMAGLLGATAHWVFNRSRIWGLPPGEYTVTISGAAETAALSGEELERRVVADLEAYFPGAASAKPPRASVVKEARATVLLGPGAQAARPRTGSGVDGLFLAGDWTATGLPSTIEGAVISGFRAAAALARRHGLDLPLPLPPPEPDWPVRLLRCHAPRRG